MRTEVVVQGIERGMGWHWGECNKIAGQMPGRL